MFGIILIGTILLVDIIEQIRDTRQIRKPQVALMEYENGCTTIILRVLKIKANPICGV